MNRAAQIEPARGTLTPLPLARWRFKGKNARGKHVGVWRCPFCGEVLCRWFGSGALLFPLGVDAHAGKVQLFGGHNGRILKRTPRHAARLAPSISAALGAVSDASPKQGEKSIEAARAGVYGEETARKLRQFERDAQPQRGVWIYWDNLPVGVECWGEGCQKRSRIEELSPGFDFGAL